jgi:hypothetical protein
MYFCWSSGIFSSDGRPYFQTVLFYYNVAYRPVARQRPRNKNETAAIARQRPARNNGSTVESGVFYVVRFEAVSLHRPSTVK